METLNAMLAEPWNSPISLQVGVLIFGGFVLYCRANAAASEHPGATRKWNFLSIGFGVAALALQAVVLALVFLSRGAA